MASRLLKALDARIANCRDPVESTCLQAERAALLARQGHLEEARAELAAIHARYDSRPNARVSAWTSLAEGLVAFCGNFTRPARDKVLRALALSSAIGDSNLRALSAAWLAHMNYLEQDFEPMVQNLHIALTHAPAAASSTLARANLVVAQGFHWADRYDLAQPWYSKARLHATKEGDETLLSALMHSMAWLRAAQARRMAFSGPTDRRQVLQILLGADSTSHFDQRVGSASLRSLVPILRAYILTLLNRYADALALFDAHLGAALAEGFDRLRSGLLAETAWCRVNLGDSLGAQRLAREAQLQIGGCGLADERGAAHGRLAQVFTALNDRAAATHHCEHAHAEWHRHAERQARLLALMSSTSAIVEHGADAG